MSIKNVKQKLDKSLEGRTIVRADSRPRDYTINFVSRGDSLTSIGDGKILFWDFSNANDLVTDSLTTTIPVNMKRKRIPIGFSESVYIKEGTIYFFDCPKGQYLDLYVVCKSGGYYKDPNGTIPGSALGLLGEDFYTLAVVDTPIIHYVNYHHMQGSCPMGDELNTEGATESSLPTQQNGYQIWLEVTTPSTDVISNGVVEIEIYRERTILLPGESL